jgi:hypothetical protein
VRKKCRENVKTLLPLALALSQVKLAQVDKNAQESTYPNLVTQHVMGISLFGVGTVKIIFLECSLATVELN